MTTTLNTEVTSDGVVLSNKAGRKIYLIVYRRGFYEVTGGPGAAHNSWRTLEAAEFFALALYANWRAARNLHDVTDRPAEVRAP